MKKKIIGALLAATIAFVVAGCATRNNPAAWTYKVVYMDGNPHMSTKMDGDKHTTHSTPTVEDTINSMTSEGWHLVSVSAADSGSTYPKPNKMVIVFKRQK
jgi:hypothetical protein